MRQVLIGGLLIVMAAGCTATTEPSNEDGAPIDNPPAAQAWALNDGTVTEDEYRKAVTEFVVCVRAAGYAIDDPVLSPVDGLSLIYDIIPAGDPITFNTAVQDCNLATISHIEPRYVEPRHQHMDDRLRPAVDKCLRGHGVTTTGQEENIIDFGMRTENDDLLLGCVLPAVREVFPTAPKTITIRK